MTSISPATRRKFAHAWDEIDYLYFKALYWAYEKEDSSKARRFLPRLRRLLSREDPKESALLGLSARALIAEIGGRLDEAIKYRCREIKTLEYLLKLGGGAAHNLGAADIGDRLDLLANLYWSKGDLGAAQKILEKSRSYCKQHDIPFDGADMLEELLEERSSSDRNGKPKR